MCLGVSTTSLKEWMGIYRHHTDSVPGIWKGKVCVMSRATNWDILVHMYSSSR